MKPIIVATDKYELKRIVQDQIKRYGKRCSLNHIDVSLVTDMSELFSGSQFYGSISKWDVSNVIDMSRMFGLSEFNGDISKWDTSNVKDMIQMFSTCLFNQDISSWNVSSVEAMDGMFEESMYVGDLSRWRPYSLQQCTGMFKYSFAAPWWYNEKAKEVIKNLKSHDLALELKNQLILKSKTKKNKI